MFLQVQTTPVRKGKLMRKEQEIKSMRKNVLEAKNWQKQTKYLVSLSKININTYRSLRLFKAGLEEKAALQIGL